MHRFFAISTGILLLASAGCGRPAMPVAKAPSKPTVEAPKATAPADDPKPAKQPEPSKQPEPMPPSKEEPMSDAAKAELEKFQGGWILTEHSTGAPAKEPVVGKLVVTGDKYEFTINGNKTLGKLRLDPSKTPKHIDAIITDPETGAEAVLPGIYELDGDVQKSIFAQSGRPRPLDFTARAGAGLQLFVFKKEKKEQ
jgi:uncharacterized protein (TIGR03067 family)